MDMIEGASFGDNEVHISHLQFADDTILFLKPRKDYILNVRRILRCFELASGLSLNFHKSCVVRVGTKLLEEEDWAALFRCKKATLPIPYLGLPLGGNAGIKIF
ncbi:hypothetical protein Dsin_021017 [Dipteronia sinensis]|uniref:Reverse transcriptase domain-containing protein n=1 Tax=Dipteronia sinensis TaxID=43782 RepID=A0AAE0ABP2_9ROSI|nr:hypothetical protein Dsin_021017 [Dipteronia sinensis]